MNFADATEAAGLHEDGLAIKGVGDVNQDGYLDLIVLEHARPELYLNDGKGKFTRKAGAFAGMEVASKPRYVSWGLAVVTDFDNDGATDILWNGRNFLWLLRGTGDGNFTYMNKARKVEDKSAASVDDGLCFGDIDGDGALDIIGYTGSLDSQSAHSYYSLAPTERHFGLGRHGEVDVRVEFYPSGKIVKREVKANSTLVVSEKP